MYSAPNPTVITVAQESHLNSSKQLLAGPPLLNGTGRLETGRFLTELQSYVSRVRVSERLRRSEPVEEFHEIKEADYTELSPRNHTDPHRQFRPDPAETPVPAELRVLAPFARSFLSPRLVSALPLLRPAAVDDDDELLAWIFSNNSIFFHKMIQNVTRSTHFPPIHFEIHKLQMWNSAEMYM
ncbi:hypothetical protein GEMRC1_010664 [Eukaryota sp. GEM-RC1]